MEAICTRKLGPATCSSAGASGALLLPTACYGVRHAALFSMSVEIGDLSASGRANILSDSHGLAVVAIRDERVHEANAAAWQLFGEGCVGMSVNDLFRGDSSLRVRELLGRGIPALAVLKVGKLGLEAELQFLLLPASDESLLVAISSPRDVDLEADSLAKLVAANRELAGLSRELTVRIRELDAAKQELLAAKELEERLRAELEKLGRAASAVSDAVVDLPRSDVSTVLNVIALQAQALTHADFVAIGIGTDPAKPFHPWIALGVPSEFVLAIGRTPRPVGLLGVVARRGEVLRVDDLRRHSEFKGFPLQHPEMGPLLGVPIHYRGRPVGNLYLANKPGAPAFSEDDERLTRMLAARVGVAVETAMLYVGERLKRVWLQNIIDQMPDAVLLYDERGRLEATNQAGAALGCEPVAAGCASDDASGLDVRELDGEVVPFDELPLVRALHAREVTLRKEALVRRRDGSFVPVSMSAVPIRGKDGDVVGVTMIVEDISERKQAEHLRKEWAAIVAHDLRQPVNIISLSAGMLIKQHQDWPESDRRTVERIQVASAQLARMISDISHASLIESKQLSIDVEVVNLREFIESVVEGLKIIANGYELRASVEGEPQVRIDRDRIRQVLGNLVSNAAKYGRPGTPILIEARSDDDFVEVVVTNRGPGIARDQLPLLFTRFSRTREARLGKAGGLGLGLYIAKGLIEAHGGRVWAESVPNETTSIHFTLPKLQKQSSRPRRGTSAKSRVPAAAEPPRRLRNVRAQSR